MGKAGIKTACWTTVAALCWALAFSTAAAEDGRGSAPVGASLVFVTQSDACDCVANLCVAGEQEVLNFLGTTGDQIRYQRVDLTEDAAAGKRYRAVTLPVVLLFDAAGEEIARFDSFFTEAQLNGVWQQHLATREAKP
jgi:hypothetical protein